MNEQEILTLREVAAFLRVSTKTAHRLVQDRELQGFRVGRAWRVKKEDLQAFVSKPVTRKDPQP